MENSYGIALVAMKSFAYRLRSGRLPSKISPPSRGLGEQAALEALERFLRSDPAAEALLLFEDTDIERRRAIVDERVSLISTGDFLRELEEAQLIQSTDFILDQAAAQGRNVERQRRMIDGDTTGERLREQLRRT